MSKAWALVLVSVLAACGGGGTKAKTSAPSGTDTVPSPGAAPTTPGTAAVLAGATQDAVAEAEQAVPAHQGRAAPSFTPGELIGEDANTEFGYAEYEQLVQSAAARSADPDDLYEVVMALYHGRDVPGTPGWTRRRTAALSSATRASPPGIPAYQ